MSKLLRVRKIQILCLAGQVLVILSAILLPVYTLADLKAGHEAFSRGDFSRAFQEWSPLAQQGNVVAQYNLGVMYLEGRGVALDRMAAGYWFAKAAEQGDQAASDEILKLGQVDTKEKTAQKTSPGSISYAKGEGAPQDPQQAFAWFRKAAEQGDAEAQFNLGVRYTIGKGVPQDYKQAAAWHRKAAEQGLAGAQYFLGALYAIGKGVPQDYKQAAAWHRKAAEQGHAEAQFNLGFLYASGKGVPQDYKQAVAWYRKAAEQGYAEAQFNLGVLYDRGDGVPQDHKQAVAWSRKAVEQGHARAQYLLGLSYASGKGVPRDYLQAYAWLSVAAANGDPESPEARVVVAALLSPQQLERAQKTAAEYFAKYQAGAGDNQYPKSDGAEGPRLVGHRDPAARAPLRHNAQQRRALEPAYVTEERQAAEQGDAESQFMLGLRYASGKGVPQDDRQAAAWYRKAAEQGLAEAQYFLGALYAIGKGVPQDYKQAVAWYRKAAEQGYAEAQFKLGLRYANGGGVPQDDRQAVAWYRKAAEQGDASAQYLLGLSYATGDGVPQDYLQAYAWLSVAAANGDPESPKDCDKVAALLSPQQLERAQKTAAEYFDKYQAETGDSR